MDKDLQKWVEDQLESIRAEIGRQLWRLERMMACLANDRWISPEEFDEIMRGN